MSDVKRSPISAALAVFVRLPLQKKTGVQEGGGGFGLCVCVCRIHPEPHTASLNGFASRCSLRFFACLCEGETGEKPAPLTKLTQHTHTQMYGSVASRFPWAYHAGHGTKMDVSHHFSRHYLYSFNCNQLLSLIATLCGGASFDRALSLSFSLSLSLSLFLSLCVSSGSAV